MEFEKIRHWEKGLKNIALEQKPIERWTNFNLYVSSVE